MKRPYLLKSRRNHWYYRLAGEADFHTTGIRNTGPRSRAGAERFAMQRTQEYARAPNRTDATYRQYTSGYYLPGTDPRALRKRDERRPIGLEHLRNSRRWLELYVWTDTTFANRRMREITQQDFLDFRHRLVRKLGDRLNTVNKVLSTAKVPFREAVHAGHIEHDPTLGVGTIRESRKTRDVLTAAEYRQLFPQDGVGPWMVEEWARGADGKSTRELVPDRLARAAFELSAVTGKRRGEMMALRWGAVDLDRAQLQVLRAWKRGEKAEGSTKSGKTRFVPLPDCTVKTLRDLRDASIRHHPDDLVFCRDDGERMGETWWRTRFRAALRCAGIQTEGRNLVLHSLRHSLATILAGEGYDLRFIRETLGWSGEDVQRMYTHYGVEHLRGQAAILDRILAESD